MKQIHISKIEDVNNYWLVYRDDSDTVRHLDLSACANSYARRHPECPQAGHRIIGTRKLQGAMGVYELYDIGHSRSFVPPSRVYGPPCWQSSRARRSARICGWNSSRLSTKTAIVPWRRSNGSLSILIYERESIHETPKVFVLHPLDVLSFDGM